MEMVDNCSFTLTTGIGKRSRVGRLKWWRRPTGSTLAPLFFNIYLSDLPATVSRKYAYVDDLAIMHADGDWVENGRGTEEGHGNRRFIPLDKEAKSQHYENGAGSLPPQQGS